MITKQVFTAKSMAASFNSVEMEVLGKPFKMEMAWTGTVAGTFKLQESNSKVVWTDITGADFTVTNDGNGSFSLTTENLHSYIRVVWTRTSGTGTVDAYLTVAE